MDRKIERNRRPSLRRLGAAAAALIAAGLLFAMLRSSSTATYRIDRDRVTVSTVVRGRFEDFIQISANVMPLKTVYLDAIDGGGVERVLVEEGAMVEAGQLLIELSNTQLQLDAISHEAQASEQLNDLRDTRLALEQDRLQLKRDMVEIDYQIRRLTKLVERRKKMLKNDMVARRDYDDAVDELRYYEKRRALTLERQAEEERLGEAQLNSLEEAIDRLQRNLEITHRNLERLNIRAPISGQLTSLNAEVGEFKAAGGRIGQIDDVTRFKVTALVDEFYVGRVRRGQTGEFVLQDRSYSLTVAKVYPEIKSGRFEMDLAFGEEQPTRIQRGQTLKIRLQLGEPEEALLLAQGGFLQDTGGDWAFVVDESGRFAVKRRLHVGRRNPRNIEVLNGLAEGDEVITSSYVAFVDMDRVEFKDAN